MTKKQLTTEGKRRVSEASRGLKKVTPEQATAIKKFFDDENNEKISQIEKVVSKKVLFELTGLNKYAPKMGRSEKAMQLNAILFD